MLQLAFMTKIAWSESDKISEAVFWFDSVGFSTLQVLVLDAINIFWLVFYFTNQPQQMHRKLENYTENEKGKFGIRYVSKGRRLTEKKKTLSAMASPPGQGK